MFQGPKLGQIFGGGELTPYINSKTGKDDPAIRFDRGGFVHLSTCHRYGIAVRDEQGNKL